MGMQYLWKRGLIMEIKEITYYEVNGIKFANYEDALAYANEVEEIQTERKEEIDEAYNYYIELKNKYNRDYNIKEKINTKPFEDIMEMIVGVYGR